MENEESGKGSRETMGVSPFPPLDYDHLERPKEGEEGGID